MDMEWMEQLEYRTFLLRVANDLNEKQFTQLKFVLKGCISSGTCEEIKEVCDYFAELERRQFLTPTKLGILKTALDAVGRSDLVEEIEKKEPYFTNLFSPKVKPGDNLEPKDYDAACDGIQKEAGNLKALDRSGQNTPDLQKQLELTVTDNKDEEQIQQFTNALPNSHNLQTAVPTYGKQKGGPPHPTGPETGSSMATPTPQYPQKDKVAPSGVTLDEAQSNSSEGVVMSSGEGLMLNKPSPKEPGESTEIDDTSEEKTPLRPNVTGVSTGATSLPAKTPPIMPSHLEPSDDYVTDGNEGKEGESQEVAGHKKTTSQEVTSADLHGTIAEENPTVYGTCHLASNAKEPTEDECLSPTSPKGTFQPTDVPMADSEESEPQTKKTKTSQLVPGQGPSAQKSQHPSGACKGLSSSEGASCFTGPGHDHGPSPFGSAAPQTGMVIKGPGLDGLFASAGPSCQSPMYPAYLDSPPLSESYNRKGYSVSISHGTLYDSSDTKGVVMMESGAQFFIAIANNNVHAAEVDITFGGMYLGVWVVEAKRPLSNPLIIQGSAWAPGRLTYFSASDPDRPGPNKEFGEKPEFNGIIELEFKPEIHVFMLKLYVQHVRKEGLEEIFMPVNEKATVGDLKKMINKKLKDKVSCLVKSNSEILQEDKTMSSLALENSGEEIQVLHMEEELLIEFHGMEPVTMTVDPFDISAQKVKDFIAQRIKIPVAEQRVCFEGQNIDEVNLLTDVLVKSKKTPVLKVDKDRAINIKVHLPNGREHKVEMNWFETVNALKKKMEELQICESSATLKFNNSEISYEGRKQLIDLGFKDQSKVTVHSEALRTPHRGFSADKFQGSRTRLVFGSSGLTRGFGDESFGAKSTFRGPDDGDFHSAFSTLRSGPEDMQHDSTKQEGIAMLYGNEENVSSLFQKDEGTWKFSKEDAVVLIIQLIDKRTGATGSSTSSIPAGRHRPKHTDGPMSTPTPPPVPE